MSLPTEHLINELQSFGVRLADPKAGVESRRGGAGPSDHKALTIDGVTIMAPVHTAPAFDSPYIIEKPNASGASRILRDGLAVAEVRFPERPRFYDLKTEDGVPYSHIATLHGRDVLATTVLQTCIRYQSRTKTCQFCAIGQSLAAGRTVERKTPAQLAEVARAAVELDGVKHMVMTTGTPPGRDRGAAISVRKRGGRESRRRSPDSSAVRAARRRLPGSNVLPAPAIDSLGMHLEVVTPDLRRKLMPGKSEVSVERYFKAFAAAVPVFGRGQVSTYILAGLGDSADAILEICEQLVGLGVYPFVVPFVPISGTPLESHAGPAPEFMHAILKPLAAMLAASGLRATDIKAGCGKCGACSALSTYERRLAS